MIRAIVVLVILYLIWSTARYTKVPAGVHQWSVVRDFDNNREAADLLARVNSRMIEFMRYLRRKYHIAEDDATIGSEGAGHWAIVRSPGDLHNIVSHMLRNYNPEAFYENDPRFTSDTSYTVAKGRAMYVCLRQKENPMQLVDEDVLLFTMIHEASHIANYQGWAHGRDFWSVFKFMLQEATASGVYRPVDYAKQPVKFCGLLVNYNPLFDSSVRIPGQN